MDLNERPPLPKQGDRGSYSFGGYGCKSEGGTPLGYVPQLPVKASVLRLNERYRNRAIGFRWSMLRATRKTHRTILAPKAKAGVFSIRGSRFNLLPIQQLT